MTLRRTTTGGNTFHFCPRGLWGHAIDPYCDIEFTKLRKPKWREHWEISTYTVSNIALWTELWEFSYILGPEEFTEHWGFTEYIPNTQQFNEHWEFTGYVVGQQQFNEHWEFTGYVMGQQEFFEHWDPSESNVPPIESPYGSGSLIFFAPYIMPS